MSTENERLEIEPKRDGSKLNVVLKGEISVNTSKDFDAFLNDNLADVKALEFDLTDVLFVSSAGLRVFLNAQKVMDKQGSMVIRNMSEEVREVFDMTGFSEVMTIE